MMIEKLFNPKSIAVIGASSNKKKLGYQIIDNLKKGGFSGAVYPVNLSAKRINSFRVYADINDIKGTVDLVEIVIPAELVAPEVDKCAKKGIKNIIIISAGFSESASGGKAKEEELKKIARTHGLNILGPNCFGLISTDRKLNTTFAKTKALAGRIGFISQSGAIGSAVLDWAEKKSVGFSKFVSLGNKAVLDECDFFEYFKNDDKTDLAVAYLENIKNGHRFLQVVSKLARIKPVAILKAGRSEAGAHAALSHTGSLVGSDAVIKAAFARCGVLVLDDIGEMFDLMLFYRRKFIMTNNKIFLVSNAGGPLVLAADEISQCGLELAGFEQKTIMTLMKKLPAIVSIKNPLDLIGDADADRYKIALENILKDNNADTLLTLLTPQTSSEIDKTAEIISALSNKHAKKTICASFIGGSSVKNASKIFSEKKVAHFDFPYRAIKALSKLSSNQAVRKQIKPYLRPLAKAVQPSKLQLDYLSALSILNKYGIKTVKSDRVTQPRDLLDLEYPLALKVVGEKLIHKTEDKAVVLNIKGPDQATRIFAGFKGLLEKEGNYCLAQTMVKGTEIILGFKRDQSFGPILMVGWGGVYAEVLKDAIFLIDDIGLREAKDAIKKLKVYRILAGIRGQERGNIDALVQALVSLAKIAQENPEISELDINPLFVNGDEAIAADVRIIK